MLNPLKLIELLTKWKTMTGAVYIPSGVSMNEGNFWHSHSRMPVGKVPEGVI